MAESRTSLLPTEIELALEVMPCQALRRSYDSAPQPHACSYFAEWGYYHSYDYGDAGPPESGSTVLPVVYAGKHQVVPELLSGCLAQAQGYHQGDPGRGHQVEGRGKLPAALDEEGSDHRRRATDDAQAEVVANRQGTAADPGRRGLHHGRGDHPKVQPQQHRQPHLAGQSGGGVRVVQKPEHRPGHE